MKIDPRVRYTRMIIQTAFLDLLQQKPVNKITVREVCDKAEINRSTFYKHYQDCYDLLEKIKADALAQLDEWMADMDGQGIEPVILTILRTLKNKQQMFKLVAQNGGRGEFTHQVVRRGFRYMDMHMAVSPARGWNETQKGMSYAFLTGGISSVIEYWMQGGCKEPSEQVAAVIIELGECMTDALAEN